MKDLLLCFLLFFISVVHGENWRNVTLYALPKDGARLDRAQESWLQKGCPLWEGNCNKPYNNDSKCEYNDQKTPICGPGYYRSGGNGLHCVLEINRPATCYLVETTLKPQSTSLFKTSLPTSKQTTLPSSTSSTSKLTKNPRSTYRSTTKPPRSSKSTTLSTQKPSTTPKPTTLSTQKSTTFSTIQTQEPTETTTFPAQQTSSATLPIATSTIQTQTCFNYHYLCQYWAQNGECEKNPYYMMPNCQMACQSCGETLEDVIARNQQTQNCYDNNPYCAYWASVGECGRYLNYMLVYCKASCGVC